MYVCCCSTQEIPHGGWNDSHFLQWPCSVPLSPHRPSFSKFFFSLVRCSETVFWSPPLGNYKSLLVSLYKVSPFIQCLKKPVRIFIKKHYLTKSIILFPQISVKMIHFPYTFEWIHNLFKKSNVKTNLHKMIVDKWKSAIKCSKISLW